MSKLNPKVVLSRLDGAHWTRKRLRPFGTAIAGNCFVGSERS